MPHKILFQIKMKQSKLHLSTILLLIICFLSSCKKTETEKLKELLQQWSGKEIIFPSKPVFSIYGEEEVDVQISQAEYKIVRYIDSIDCTSCKLQLDKWKEFIAYTDSATNHSVPCLLFIHPKSKREVKIALKNERFNYPICFDTDNEFYKLNKFSFDPLVQTFLLDKDNKIIGIGDPAQKAKVKELYLNLIAGKREKQEMEQTRTNLTIDKKVIDFGTFNWKEKQDTVVTLTNTGKERLVIFDIATSCGCTVAEYDKHPAEPGKTLNIKVSFQADRPEHFNKTIVIYCNSESSPIGLQIKGRAENK